MRRDGYNQKAGYYHSFIDVYVQGRRTRVRLHEKGGKRHEMPCHHCLENYLEAYIDQAGLEAHPKSYLFRTTEGQSGTLTERPMSQPMFTA